MGSYSITAGASQNTGLLFAACWNRSTEVTREAITSSTKVLNDDLKGSKLGNARHKPTIASCSTSLRSRIMGPLAEALAIERTSVARRAKGYASSKVVSCMLMSPELIGMERNLHRERQPVVNFQNADFIIGNTA